MGIILRKKEGKNRAKTKLHETPHTQEITHSGPGGAMLAANCSQRTKPMSNMQCRLVYTSLHVNPHVCGFIPSQNSFSIHTIFYRSHLLVLEYSSALCKSLSVFFFADTCDSDTNCSENVNPYPSARQCRLKSAMRLEARPFSASKLITKPDILLISVRSAVACCPVGHQHWSEIF